VSSLVVHTAVARARVCVCARTRVVAAALVVVALAVFLSVVVGGGRCGVDDCGGSRCCGCDCGSGGLDDVAVVGGCSGDIGDNGRVIGDESATYVHGNEPERGDCKVPPACVPQN
jgi:hypothetical protein